MVTKQALIDLLEDNIVESVLLIGERQAKYTVAAYDTPAQLLKDYLLNMKVDVLFTVREASGAAKRHHQGKPLRRDITFEVSVWCTNKLPERNADYDTLRGYGCGEVARILDANAPTQATFEVSRREDDHMIGNVKVYNTIFQVTSINHL